MDLTSRQKLTWHATYRVSANFRFWNRTRNSNWQPDTRKPRMKKIAYKLVTSHLRLVVKVVSKYRGYGLPLGEMISEGNIGLLFMRSTNLSRPRGFVFPPMLCGGLRPRYRNIFSIRGRWSKSVQRPRRKNSFSICAKSRTSLI